MALTIARQVFSQAKHALAQPFISEASCLSHSVAHALHASAHAAQEYTISGLPLATMSADRFPKDARASRCSTVVPITLLAR
jgi:hypothetical protein